MLHLVTHVMVAKGILIDLLKHELMKNHDGNDLEHHLAEEMPRIECDLVTSKWATWNQQHATSVLSCHKEVCTIYQIDVGPLRYV